jgi:hypothetical protein
MNFYLKPYDFVIILLLESPQSGHWCVLNYKLQSVLNGSTRMVFQWIMT